MCVFVDLFLIIFIYSEELQTELGQLSVMDAMIEQPLYEIAQVISPLSIIGFKNFINNV